MGLPNISESGAALTVLYSRIPRFRAAMPPKILDAKPQRRKEKIQG
jgi:hypothetical protein